MQASRIPPLWIAVIGAVLCIAAPVIMFFLMIKPMNEKIAAQQAIVDANAQYVGPGPLMDAQRKLAQAKSDLTEEQQQWNYIMTTKNPKIDMSDRFLAWEQYWRELEYNLSPILNKFWLRNVAMARRGGAAVPLGTLTFPGPSSDPNSVNGTILTIPLTMDAWSATGDQGGGGGGQVGGSQGGTISVMGTFPADLQNVANWNKFSRIVEVDGLTLSGYSPFITASYNAKIYEFLTNADKPGPAVPTGAKQQ